MESRRRAPPEQSYGRDPCVRGAIALDPPGATHGQAIGCLACAGAAGSVFRGGPADAELHPAELRAHRFRSCGYGRWATVCDDLTSGDGLDFALGDTAQGYTHSSDF